MDVLERRIGSRRVRLLVRRDEEPAVVDVGITAPGPDESLPEEELGRDPKTGLVDKWLTAIESRVWPSGARDLLRRVRAQIPTPNLWEGPTTFDRLDMLPLESGLYFIVWPHGAYLGMTADSLRKRVGDHRKSYREFNFEPPQRGVEFRYKVYWLRAPGKKNSGGTTDLENRYLNLISGQATPRFHAGAATRAPNRVPGLARQGFRNLQEVEFEVGRFGGST
jgi:hypothetical protein